MPTIPPVRIQYTICMIINGIVTHPADIFIGNSDLIYQLIPATHPRAVIKSRSGPGKFSCGILRPVSVISPVQADGFLWQFLYSLRKCTDDIAPEHRDFSFAHHIPAQFFDKIQVHTLCTFCLCQPGTFSFSKIKGFIRTDIKIL